MTEFQTTNWNLVAAAASAGITDQNHAALDQLCEMYRPRVLESVRRIVRDPDRAQDLVQSFFAHIVEHNYQLAKVDPQHGRFRAWLLGALKHFVANEERRARTQKRGGNVVFLPLDETSANGGDTHEPAPTCTPERLYERQWALTVLELALSRVEAEYMAKGQGERFEQLRGCLVESAPSYELLAVRLGAKPATLRVEVYRLRQRYRHVLRSVVEVTVARRTDVDDELRHLLDVLSEVPWTLARGSSDGARR